MNLHTIAAGVIAAVNPMLPASIQISTGYQTGADGKRVSQYGNPPVNAPVQVQALSYRDLQQLDGMNLNGEKRAIYVYGQLHATQRLNSKGGDIITLANGTPNDGVWLTVQVLEQFQNWVKVAVTLQNGA